MKIKKNKKIPNPTFSNFINKNIRKKCKKIEKRR